MAAAWSHRTLNNLVLAEASCSRRPATSATTLRGTPLRHPRPRLGTDARSRIYRISCDWNSRSRCVNYDAMGFQAVLCSSDSALCTFMPPCLQATPCKEMAKQATPCHYFTNLKKSLSHIRGAVLASLLLCVEMRVRRALRITLIV